MDNKMMCSKVNSMLAMYIDGKLDEMQEEFVKDHLQTCPGCRTKYEYLKKLVDTLKSSYASSDYSREAEKNKVAAFKIQEYEYYRQNLSAYFDNELPFEDSVRFKKYIMKIPVARQELQKIYDLQEMLKNNWAHNRKRLNQDLSKTIISRAYSDRNSIHTLVWTKIAAVIFAVFVFSSASAVYYYAKHVHHHPYPQKQQYKIAQILKKI